MVFRTAPISIPARVVSGGHRKIRLPQVKELVLVNCCDTIRSVYDILEDSGKLDFLYMIDMLHCDGECSSCCLLEVLEMG